MSPDYIPTSGDRLASLASLTDEEDVGPQRLSYRFTPEMLRKLAESNQGLAIQADRRKRSTPGFAPWFKLTIYTAVDREGMTPEELDSVSAILMDASEESV